MVVSKIVSSGSNSVVVSAVERSDTRFKKMSGRSCDGLAIRKIQEWTVTQVIQLLKQKNLSECTEAIKKHEIDGQELLMLTEGRLALWKRDIKTEASRKLMDLVNDLNANPDEYISSGKKPLYQPKPAAKTPINQPKPVAKPPFNQPKPALKAPIIQLPKPTAKSPTNQLPKPPAKTPINQAKPAAVALSKGPPLPIAVFQEKQEETNDVDFLNKPVQKLNSLRLNPNKLADKLAQALNERSKLVSQIKPENKMFINSKSTTVPTTSTLNKRPLPSLPHPEQEDTELVYANQEPEILENEEEKNLYFNNVPKTETVNDTNVSEVEEQIEEEEEPPYYFNNLTNCSISRLLPPKSDHSSESLNSWDSFDDVPVNQEKEPLQTPARPVKNSTLFQKEEQIQPPMSFRPLIQPPPPPPKTHKNESEIEEEIYELPDEEKYSLVGPNDEKMDDGYEKPIVHPGGPPLPAKPYLMSVMEVRRRSDSSNLSSGSSGDGTIGRTLGWVNKVLKGSNLSLNSNERTPQDLEKSPEPKKPSAVGLKGSNSSLGSSSSSGTLKTQRPLPAPPTHAESPRKLPNGASAQIPLFISWQGQPWYFNSPDRTRAEELVIAKGEEGCFLFRPSRRTANPLTLTLFSNGRVYNIPVRKRTSDNLYALGSEKDNEMTFASIEEIVNYYKKEQLILYSGGAFTGRVYLRSWPSLR